MSGLYDWTVIAASIRSGVKVSVAVLTDGQIMSGDATNIPPGFDRWSCGAVRRAAIMQSGLVMNRLATSVGIERARLVAKETRAARVFRAACCGRKRY